jgi:hypothetical protein
MTTTRYLQLTCPCHGVRSFRLPDDEWLDDCITRADEANDQMGDAVILGDALRQLLYGSRDAALEAVASITDLDGHVAPLDIQYGYNDPFSDVLTGVRFVRCPLRSDDDVVLEYHLDTRHIRVGELRCA